jgi:RHS repeat-associated protein
MPGRDYQSEKYRYGFGSKEKDHEMKGKGNSYDFGARIYDPRLGRWLSLDPLMSKYPGMSPYNYTANNPILYIDQDGKDYGVYINHDESYFGVPCN